MAKSKRIRPRKPDVKPRRVVRFMTNSGRIVTFLSKSKGVRRGK